MKINKAFDKEKIKNDLKKSIEYNNEALDYLKNEINRKNDMCKYNETEELKSEINILKYIEFTLKFVGNNYDESLKKLGVLDVKKCFRGE